LSLKELLSRTNIANVTASAIMLGAVVYAALSRDVELLKYIASFAAGYLFSRAARGE